MTRATVETDELDTAAQSEPGRREQAKAERRQKIITAARDLIRETGDTNLSMRMIAQRAEVSIATPYNLFGSKRAVVTAVLEDQRDFVHRFKSLKVSNAIDRIFKAHALGMSYFVEDPDFYRPLTKAVLGSNGDDGSGLGTPERQAQTRAAWHWLLGMAQDDRLLSKDFPPELIERTLSHLITGAMSSWTMGGLPTEDLLPTIGLGYALILSAVATPAGKDLLEQQIAIYRNMLES